MMELAMIEGALAGVIYAAGQHGLIPAWGGGRDTPALIRLALVLMLVAVAAGRAESGSGFALLALVAVGAAKVADLAVSVVLEAAGFRPV